MRRAITVVGLAVTASLALALGATAATSDSIKLILPKPLVAHKNLTLELTGEASGTKPEVWLYSQPQSQPCKSTMSAEAAYKNLTGWISGARVHGHYRYKFKGGFANPTTGTFCAYLTSFSPTFSFITEAHEALRFKASG